MNYETQYSAYVDLRSMSKDVSKIASILPFPAIETRTIGDVIRPGKAARSKENYVQCCLADKETGYVEDAVEELCKVLDSAEWRDNVQLLDGVTIWLIIQILDKEFVELHFVSESLAVLANYGVSMSVENRFSS